MLGIVMTPSIRAKMLLTGSTTSNISFDGVNYESNPLVDMC
jgi:hypothetical protein